MIRVIAGGKKSRDWEILAVAEYEKRLTAPYDLEWQFCEEAQLAKRVGKLGSEYYVILLDEGGKMLSSVEFAKGLEMELVLGKKIVLVLGGAFGHFDETVLARADLVWSLSRLVFPHRLCRAIVAEQVYRAQQINTGRPYHHA